MRRRIWAVIAVLGALALVTDLLLGRDVPGLTAGLGLVGCMVIILASKRLGKHLLQRHEEYYE